MFSPNDSPFCGNNYRDKVRALPNKARDNFNVLDAAAGVFTHRKWQDILTDDQEQIFSWINNGEDWDTVAGLFRDDLMNLPVLSVGAVYRTGRIKYVVAATATGRAAAFSLDAFEAACTSDPPLQRADMLPKELLLWVASEDVLLLVADPRPNFSKSPLGMEANNVVHTDKLYAVLQNSGFISTPVKTEGDITCQAALTHAYHHRQCTKSDFRALVGKDKYGDWPPYREVYWRVQGATEPNSPQEAWFLYHEAVTAFAFVNHVLRRALVYGGVSWLRRGAHFVDFYISFLENIPTRSARPLRAPSAAAVDRKKRRVSPEATTSKAADPDTLAAQEDFTMEVDDDLVRDLQATPEPRPSTSRPTMPVSLPVPPPLITKVSPPTPRPQSPPRPFVATPFGPFERRPAPPQPQVPAGNAPAHDEGPEHDPHAAFGARAASHQPHQNQSPRTTDPQGYVFFLPIAAAHVLPPARDSHLLQSSHPARHVDTI